MDWIKHFVIYRVSNDEGVLVEVYQAESMEKAKYWLNYLGKPGDVCCRTPLHPKHTQATSRPEYLCHREEDRKTLMNRAEWSKYTKSLNGKEDFPERPQEVSSEV